jgi:hypothetical protein
MDNIVRHVRGLEIGGVLEHVGTHDIAQRPDAGDVCAQVLIGLDEAMLVQLHIGYGHAAGGSIGLACAVSVITTAAREVRSTIRRS